MIPKIIHYCWFGGNPLPELAQKCIASWKKYCPDYKIIEWNESNYDVTKNTYMYEAYQSKKWGFVPDFARLDIVFEYGGIYLDTDVEIIRSFDSLLSEKAFMGFETVNTVAPGLGFGAEAHCPIIGDIINSVYRDRHFIVENGEYDTTPSPRLNTAYLVSRGLSANGIKQSIDGLLTIYPAEYFAPKDYKTGTMIITKNTYSIHHYDASWLEPEDRTALSIRWKLRRYGRLGETISYVLARFLGIKRHIRMNGIMKTAKYTIGKLFK